MVGCKCNCGGAFGDGVLIGRVVGFDTVSVEGQIGIGEATV